MSLAQEFINTVMFLLPCYIANATPVLSSKIFPRRHPIDMGKNFVDGKRILGDHKTIEGFTIGFLTGSTVGFLLSIIGYHTPFSGAVLSLGTMLGDLTGSFLKRRLNVAPGKALPAADQLLFLVFSLLLYSILVEPVEFLTFIISILITPPLHLLTNFVAFKLGLKSVPW
ncbi:MAG: CDP-2,3-bis-(O-geranylgeranyl)-sn-glycerol synthase [Thermoproteales archaeon]|nr:CDP-2,3-bis-(O-geranylgeranyl)-sn-glycerol synthase [Thermoproteales archaeon]